MSKPMNILTLPGLIDPHVHLRDLGQTKKEDFSDARVEAVIKTASVTTDNDKRDNHLRSDEFFNAEKYPEMVFKSTSMEKTGKDTYKISGLLTIRDSTKPVVLDAKLKGRVEAWGTSTVGFKATTTINRFDFGVRWDEKMDTGDLIVGRGVEVTLLMEMSKQKKEPDSGK